MIQSQQDDKQADAPDEGWFDSMDAPNGKLPSGRGMRERILSGIYLLPALFTVMNGVLGFGAIHFATKSAQGQATMTQLAIACWLIAASMVCDMLDGRVARMTRKTSDFGGQLDSLCDAISFGVAPAIILHRTVTHALRTQTLLAIPEGMETSLERVAWCVAAIYVACAVLRLARFNVENEPDESSHMRFVGLPTPAAAGAVAAPVLYFTDLTWAGWGPTTWLPLTAAIVLPVIGLTSALLMVSRVPYPHLVNKFIRSKRSFGSLVKITVLLVLVFIEPLGMLALVAVGFVVLGLLTGLLKRRREPPPEADRISEGD
jgi:CDP-diacylglycerol--serine O-phosphatidyltransferase